MNLRNVRVLFLKEIRQGASNFFLMYALVMPVILSLVVVLVFGDLFSELPRMGIYDAGGSEVVTYLTEEGRVQTTIYSTESGLRDAVERGVVSGGIILPTDFDEVLRSGGQPPVSVLFWSESVAKDGAIINSVIDDAVAHVAAVDTFITINAVQLGNQQDIGWSERLLPMIVLMSIVLGGVMVPAASLVDEKQKRTLSALTITPVSLLDVYAAKALLGVGVSVVMALVVLVLNDAFGGQPVLLVSVLALGSVASSVFGVLIGSLVRDINMLLAVLKTAGLVLLAPALIQLAPEIPQWIAQVFPTYYVFNPVLEVSQDGAVFGDIVGQMAVLLAIIGAMIFALVLIIERQQKQIALAS